MKSVCCGWVALCVLALALAPARAEGELAHMVFFQLAEKNEANQKKLVQACHKYLSGHEGTVYFSVGTRGEEFKRDVNATDYDVALHIVFKDKAAHDKYQDHPRHLEFIAKNKHLWKNVRVFDSYLVPGAKGKGADVRSVRPVESRPAAGADVRSRRQESRERDPDQRRR